MRLVVTMNDVLVMAVMRADEMHVLLRQQRHRQQTKSCKDSGHFVKSTVGHREDYWRCEPQESNPGGQAIQPTATGLKRRSIRFRLTLTTD